MTATDEVPSSTKRTISSDQRKESMEKSDDHPYTSSTKNVAAAGGDDGPSSLANTIIMNDDAADDSSGTTTTTTTNIQRKKQLAQHRWKILRQALLKKHAGQQQSQSQNGDGDDDSPTASQHKSTSVYDYNLLPPPVRVSIHPDKKLISDKEQQEQQDKWNKLKNKLCSISPSFVQSQAAVEQGAQKDEFHTAAAAFNRAFVDELEVSLLALMSLEEEGKASRNSSDAAGKTSCSVVDFDLFDSSTNGQPVPHHQVVLSQSEQKLQQQHQQPSSKSTDNGHQVLVLDATFISKELCERCGFDECRIALLDGKGPDKNETDDTQRRAQVLRVEYRSPSSRQQYAIHEYPLLHPSPNNAGTPPPTVPSFSIYARERIAHCLSLQELTSHRNEDQGAVDNTGNICVWDSEKTLVWAMQQDHQEQMQCQHEEERKDELLKSQAASSPPSVVLELGAGMAGLAALAVSLNRTSCKSKQQKQQPSQTIYITDGHSSSIQNNRVNVRLMQAASMIAASSFLHLPVKADTETETTLSSSNNNNSSGPPNVDVQCFQLKWTLDKDDDDVDGMGDEPMSVHKQQPQLRLRHRRADLTLVSDCTHFQNFHGELLWTMVRHTTIGGRIYMCQPHRGNSLARFLTLMEAVNQQPQQGEAKTMPLVRVQERSYALLDEKHEHFLRHDDDFYRPNVHRPIILVLHKLREATEEDRLTIVRHVQERDA